MRDRESFFNNDGDDDVFRADAKACEIAIEALEKQIPKKPKQLESVDYFECPCCKRIITMHERAHGNLKIPFCKWCGQALDWSEDSHEN